MDISNWNLYYKTHETENRPTTTQMCYEPRVNPENNVFCMNFCYPCDYQTNQPRLSYTQELVDAMFDRELKYLNLFQSKPWAPEILEITDNKIFIKWYGRTCNDIQYKDCNLNKLFPNWYDDIKSIIIDQVNMGYLKSSMYPHSHYYDDQGQMRAIDFYTTVERSTPYLTKNQILGLVGTDTNRFNDATENDLINVETIFKSGLLSYSRWPQNLTEIYNTIYE